MVDKVERNGKVAVLVSPDFGAGWSTWGDADAEAKLFCQQIISAIESGAGADDLLELADSLFPNSYNGGASDLVVMWVDKGAAFRITEYDGSETLEIIGEIDHYIA